MTRKPPLPLAVANRNFRPPAGTAFLSEHLPGEDSRQDMPNYTGVLDERDMAHETPAIGTHQRINLEHPLADDLGGDPAQISEQPPVLAEGHPQHLGDRQHDLAVRHRPEHRGVQPLGESHPPFGVVRGAEMPRLQE